MSRNFHRRKIFSSSRFIAVCCMLLCLGISSMSSVVAEEYHLSLPRIEAAHFEEIFDENGKAVRGSHGYENSQWLEEDDWDEEEMDTLEMAEGKLKFTIARPTYLPEGSHAGDIWISGYSKHDQYDSVEYRYSVNTDYGTRSFTFYQDCVGLEAYLKLETTDQIEQVEYEEKQYLCVNLKSETYNNISYSLYWLEEEFAFCVEAEAYTLNDFTTDDERQRFETYPYLDELLRIASSLTMTSDGV